MTMSAEDFENQAGQGQDTPRTEAGPVVEDTAWGYIIRESKADHAVRAASSITGRFFGAILLMAACGLWVMPHALYGADLFGMKIAATVMFSVLGGYFIWAGRHAQRPEFRIDTKHREIRIGFREQGDSFSQTTRVDFDKVGSVFLLRSEDQPTRLFLRLAELDTGIEIGAGNRNRMEALKQRLADDLTGQTRPPVTRQLDRHQTVAA